MISKSELYKLRTAAKNIRTENDTFYIKGKYFSCIWKENNFLWTIDNRTYNCTVKEVIEFMGDGRYIEDYCYDYNNY